MIANVDDERREMSTRPLPHEQCGGGETFSIRRVGDEQMMTAYLPDRQALVLTTSSGLG